MNLTDYIRTIPDWPQEGILFRDITPLLENPAAVEYCLAQFAELYPGESYDKIVMPEARGFILGAPLAARMQKGMVLARKPGKLPREAVSATFEKEYGTDQLFIHKDSIKQGERVLVVDDVLATGNTIKAVGQMVDQLGGVLVGYAFLIELLALKGRDKLGSAPIEALVQY